FSAFMSRWPRYFSSHSSMTSRRHGLHRLAFPHGISAGGVYQLDSRGRSEIRGPIAHFLTPQPQPRQTLLLWGWLSFVPSTSAFNAINDQEQSPIIAASWQ